MNGPEREPLFIRPVSLARTLGISTRRMRSWLDAGEIASVGIGRTRLVSIETATALIRGWSGGVLSERARISLAALAKPQPRSGESPSAHIDDAPQPDPASALLRVAPSRDSADNTFYRGRALR